MLASVTRLRVRSLRYLPAFLWQTFLSQRQVVRAPGFSGGKLLIDRRRTFWTLTPVSYTHLDVYKRQAVDRGAKTNDVRT